jgi:4-hydroxy-tetrahydrodipicolinate synthase
MTVTSLSGLFPAPAVPFDAHDRIAEEELAAHLAAMGRVEGVSGLAVNGHAGELAGLTRDERRRVVRLARAALPAGKIVISGVDEASPEQAVEELAELKGAGADAALVLPPFDNMARRSIAGNRQAVVGYFSALARAELPLVVFQYPRATGASYPTPVLAELARMDHVVAVKNAVWDAELYVEQLEAIREHTSVLAACDAPELLSMMIAGADGLLLGASNVGTELWASYVSSLAEGDVDHAAALFVRRLNPLLDAQFGSTRPRSATFSAMTKECLRQLGVFSSGRMRAPEVEPDEADKETVTRALQRAGLLTVTAGVAV